MSWSSSRRSVYTAQRDSRAAFTSNDGFSVVAPMRTIAPLSTKGRKASCCARLKRWISSTNRSVRWPVARRYCPAALMISLISLMPARTALNWMSCERVSRATRRARVVFPDPGGPQRIIDGTAS